MDSSVFVACVCFSYNCSVTGVAAAAAAGWRALDWTESLDWTAERIFNATTFNVPWWMNEWQPKLLLNCWSITSVIAKVAACYAITAVVSVVELSWRMRSRRSDHALQRRKMDEGCLHKLTMNAPSRLPILERGNIAESSWNGTKMHCPAIFLFLNG